MKKNFLKILLILLSGCDAIGYQNIEIINLASDKIYAKYLKVDGNCAYNKDNKTCDIKVFKVGKDNNYSFRVSQKSFGDPRGVEKEKRFQETDGIKVYYKSTKCLIFKDDLLQELVRNNRKYSGENRILALTNNGLELLTPKQYEAVKGKYTINDKNVKCIKE